MAFANGRGTPWGQRSRPVRRSWRVLVQRQLWMTHRAVAVWAGLWLIRCSAPTPESVPGEPWQGGFRCAQQVQGIGIGVGQVTLAPPRAAVLAAPKGCYGCGGRRLRAIASSAGFGSHVDHLGLLSSLLVKYFTSSIAHAVFAARYGWHCLALWNVIGAAPALIHRQLRCDGL